MLYLDPSWGGEGCTVPFRSLTLFLVPVPHPRHLPHPDPCPGNPARALLLTGIACTSGAVASLPPPLPACPPVYRYVSNLHMCHKTVSPCAYGHALSTHGSSASIVQRSRLCLSGIPVPVSGKAKKLKVPGKIVRPTLNDAEFITGRQIVRRAPPVHNIQSTPLPSRSGVN